MTSAKDFRLLIMAQNKPNTTVSVVSSSATRYKITPEYQTLGNFSMTKQFTHKESSAVDTDLLDLLGSMSKGASSLFLVLKRGRNYKTNIVTLTEPVEPSKLSRAYRELNSLDLVKRLPTSVSVPSHDITLQYPKHTYMISPEYIRLNAKDEPLYLSLWNQL